MDSTRHSTAPKTVRAVPLDDDFDDLRSAFERRLHSDRIEFVTLSAALASSAHNVAVDLERAPGHQLRAEIFAHPLAPRRAHRGAAGRGV